MDHQKNRDEPMSDGEIVSLFWQRDEQAIRQTDRKYGRYLLAVARNIVHDRQDSEECLNDTYSDAWDAIPPAKPVVLQAFLTTIMRRRAINRFRANNRQKRAASEYAVSVSELEDLIEDGSTPETETDEKDLARCIDSFVRALPDRQLYIFVSRFYIAESLPTIAEALGCSVSTVKRELEAIRKSLRETLVKEGFTV